MSQQHTYKLCFHVGLGNSFITYSHYPPSYFDPHKSKQLQLVTILVHKHIPQEYPHYPQARMGLIETLIIKSNLYWTVLR